MSTAEIAQRLRAALFTWQDVDVVHGPLLQKQDQFFMRVVLHDGTSYYFEIGKDADIGDDNG